MSFEHELTNFQNFILSNVVRKSFILYFQQILSRTIILYHWLELTCDHWLSQYQLPDTLYNTEYYFKYPYNEAFHFL